jgi:dGTPase
MADLPPDLLRRGERWVAPYATQARMSRGRRHDEPEDLLRSPFQRDRDRIVHSNAFRRLTHKTQVFIRPEGDHYRTRLTHTLEVAQIARSLARPLGVDEDLAEALALAHDLGHPPFGHAGERALAGAMAAHGGFDHNAQSLRTVILLERRYPRFDGLNLSWETIDGLVKRKGPVADGAAEADHAGPLASIVGLLPEGLDLKLHAGLEAQAAAVADDIAYDCHDLEDGLRAGLITLADLGDRPLTAPILHAIAREHGTLEQARMVHELTRRTITLLLRDAMLATAEGIADTRASSAEAVHRAGRTLVRFSPAVAAGEADLKRFLTERVYRHDSVMEAVRSAEHLVGELFEAYRAQPSFMPDEWARGLDGDAAATARRVADYIAGMTDRFAAAEHARLCAAGPG